MSTDGSFIGHSRAMAESYRQGAARADRATDAAEWGLNMARWHENRATRALAQQDQVRQATVAELAEIRSGRRVHDADASDRAFQQQVEAGRPPGWSAATFDRHDDGRAR